MVKAPLHHPLLNWRGGMMSYLRILPDQARNARPNGLEKNAANVEHPGSRTTYSGVSHRVRRSFLLRVFLHFSHKRLKLWVAMEGC